MRITLKITPTGRRHVVFTGCYNQTRTYTRKQLLNRLANMLETSTPMSDWKDSTKQVAADEVRLVHHALRLIKYGKDGEMWSAMVEREAERKAHNKAIEAAAK